MFAKVRKHRLALLAAAAYHFVLFFPTLFLGRVVSPNDVFFNFDPWALYGSGQAQNSLINDPPTSWFTLMELMKSGAGTFHWNPYVGSGVPGYAASPAMLTPLISIPVFAVPLSWVYTAILFLKFNVAFWFAYLWLREERLGKRGAAVGALIAAGAGAVAVRWLWQATNATVLYPALLWLVRRAFNGKTNSLSLMVVVAATYALAGFPAAQAYGVYVVVAYAAFLWIRERRRVGGATLSAGVATLIALMITAPSIIPFAQFIRRTGYLAVRAQISLTTFFPSSHWWSFIDPFRLGNPADKSWLGDKALGMMNNFVEATVYVGLLTIPLALLALFNRRARSKWFWIVLTVILLASMFGLFGAPQVVGRLPGLKYSPLARLVIVLPVCAAYLAAAGTRSCWLLVARCWNRIVRLTRKVPATNNQQPASVIAAAIAVIIAYDLALVAGRFYPYLKPKDTAIPATPTIKYLQAQKDPFRVAPFFNYLWPNAAELFRIEDVRSHFTSEAKYRKLLERVDPTSWGGTSTILQFNSLKFRFDDPLVGMLGVRYLIEHKNIDIVKWHIFSATVPAVKEQGALPLRNGAVLERTIGVQDEFAIELPVHAETASGTVVITLLKNGAPVWERAFTHDEIQLMNKLYVPVRQHAGENVTVRIRAAGMSGWIAREAGTDNFFYGRVKTPIIFDRELPDGKLFLNLAEVPRFHVPRRVRILSDAEFLNTRDIDFSQEVAITEANVAPPNDSPADAVARLVRYTPSEQVIETTSSGHLFLASSEKLTPELRVTIDGKPARVYEINTMFAGVQVPAGKHRVVFERRVGRGLWWVSAAGIVLWIFAIAVLRRSRSGTRTAPATPA